jgi:hypothetical protein
MTHSTIQNPRPTTTSRPSTQAHAKQTQAQIGAETVNPSPRRANPHPDQRRDRQPKPRRANPSPDRPRDRQLKPTPSKPKLYLSFLLWRTEGEHREEKEKKKKNGREKKIEQNERERKKKKA